MKGRETIHELLDEYEVLGLAVKGYISYDDLGMTFAEVQTARAEILTKLCD